MSKTALGYVRVSTQEQKDNNSHIRQRERLERWADENDYELEILEDIAISGQSDDRPGYRQLIETYQDYDAVVVRELSRFGRAPETVMADILEIDESGTDIISITEEIDTSTAMGRFTTRIFAAVNGLYSDLRREQSIEMIQRRREEGKPIGRPTKLDESQIEQVREWHDQGHSYNTIAALIEVQFDVDVTRSTVRNYCVGDTGPELEDLGGEDDG